jgi:2-polyprenyl-6-methoxyphenol hydroxylase-like FAD-dependent oxidoreductase
MADHSVGVSAVIHDVVIAGAGPVGLFLACELRLAGVSVLVLEQAADSSSPLKQLPFGLRGLSAPTIEAFERRGLLDEMAAPEKDSIAGAAHWMRQQRRAAGHFAGIQFYQDRIDDAKWPWRLPGPAGTGMAVTMAQIEAVLTARAATLGVEIRRGVRVASFDQDDDAVTIHVGDAIVRGRWLIGCDGGRSAVRRAGGFDFVGTDPEFTGYSIEATLADPTILPLGRHYTPTGMYTYAAPGTIALVDFDGGAFHRASPITLDHAQAVLRRVSGADVTVTELHQAATWTDRAYQATDYRKGGVLLAGDAAHIHSPLGGQGLNLGLGDAMNLGWKLAATIRGDAPADLIDSYARERHSIGAQVLDWSRAQVAIMRPSPGTRALATIIRDLIETRDGATYFADRVRGTSLRYDLGDEHPLVGRSMPDFELADGTRTGAFLRGGKGLLLDFEGCDSLQALARRWPERIAYVVGDATERLGQSALLVRPDGIVAWASEGVPDPVAASAAAARWFGSPDGGREAK